MGEKCRCWFIKIQNLSRWILNGKGKKMGVKVKSARQSTTPKKTKPLKVLKTKATKPKNKESKFDKFINVKKEFSMPNRDMVDYMDVERVEEEKKTITSDLENVESPVSHSNPKEQQEQNNSDHQVGSFGIIEKLESCQNMAP